MLAGAPYDAAAPEIQADMAAAQAWMARYNASLAPDERSALLRERFAAVSLLGSCFQGAAVTRRTLRPRLHGDKQTGRETLMSDTLERVRKIVIDHLDADPDKVTEKASFIDDLGADSLDNVELVMAFEEEFDVEIPDDAAEHIQTVGDAVKFIDEKLAG